MVIDIHTHAFADAIAAAAMGALEAESGYPGSFDGTVSGLLAIMDNAGIDAAAIQPVATKPSQVRTINDWIARVASKRIVPFGAMHPELDDPAGEIARMAGSGICGFKMHPEYQRFSPDDPALAGLFDAASEAGLIVLFHAGRDIAIPTLRGTPEAFARVSLRHPGLKIILAHMGGFQLWDEVREHLIGRDVYLDTSYTLGHLPDEEFLEMIEAHGPERILFGTDAPWTDPRVELPRLTALLTDERTRSQVLGGSAEALLGPVFGRI